MFDSISNALLFWMVLIITTLGLTLCTLMIRWLRNVYPKAPKKVSRKPLEKKYSYLTC